MRDWLNGRSDYYTVRVVLLLAVVIGFFSIFLCGIWSDVYLADEAFHYRMAGYLYELKSRPLYDPLFHTNEFYGKNFYVNAPLWHGILALFWGVTGGPSQVSAQLYQAIIYIFLVFSIYLLAKEMFGEECALYSGLLAATLPFIISYSVILHPDHLLGVLCSLCFLMLLRRRFVWAAIILGLAFWTKRNAYFIAPAVLFCVLYYADGPLRQRLRTFLVFICVFGLIVIPDFYYRQTTFGLYRPKSTIMANGSEIQNNEKPSVASLQKSATSENTSKTPVKVKRSQKEEPEKGTEEFGKLDMSAVRNPVLTVKKPSESERGSSQKSSNLSKIPIIPTRIKQPVIKMPEKAAKKIGDTRIKTIQELVQPAEKGDDKRHYVSYRSIWSAGTSSTPDWWSFGDDNSTIAKDTANFKIGATSAAITHTASTRRLVLQQNVVDNYWPVARWQGRTVTFGCWVRTSTVGKARLEVEDGVGCTFSSDHTGGGGWEFLTVTRTLDASATKLMAKCRIFGGTVTAQFDGAILVRGPLIPAPAGQSQGNKSPSHQDQQSYNFLKNGSFESWSDGKTLAPYWVHPECIINHPSIFLLYFGPISILVFGISAFLFFYEKRYRQYDKKYMLMYATIPIYLIFFFFCFYGNWGLRYLSPLFPFYILIGGIGFTYIKGKVMGKVRCLLIGLCILQGVIIAYYVMGYRKVPEGLGQAYVFAKENIPQDERTLNLKGAFALYTGRPMIWHSNAAPIKLDYLFWKSNESEIKETLHKYGIRYIFIDKDRIYDDTNLHHYLGYPSSFVAKLAKYKSMKLVFNNEEAVIFQIQ